MSVAAIFNVPSNQAEFNDWSFCHSDHHTNVAAKLRTVGIVVPTYILDPINPADTGTWEYQHQLIHDAIDQVLGIQGFDLSDINWQDRNEFAGWIFLNANEHYQMAAILEVG